MTGRVLVLQNAKCESLGYLDKLLRADKYTPQILDAPSKEADISAIQPADYQMMIILGGPMAVYDNLSFLDREMQLIKKAVAKSMPVLGVCLGSQLIAQAMGGKVYPGRAKEIGWNLVSPTDVGKASLFAGLDDPLRVFQWHGDTYELPSSAEVLGYSELYPQAFRIGSAFGVQFHLEVDRGIISSWTKEYASEVTRERLNPDKIIGNPIFADRLAVSCQRLYHNFIRLAVEKNG